MIAPRPSGHQHKVLFLFEERALPPDGGGIWSACCTVCAWSAEAEWTPGCDGVALAELVLAAAGHEAEPAGLPRPPAVSR